MKHMSRQCKAKLGGHGRCVKLGGRLGKACRARHGKTTYGIGGLQARRAKRVGRQAKKSTQEKWSTGSHGMQGRQDRTKESQRHVETLREAGQAWLADRSGKCIQNTEVKSVLSKSDSPWDLASCDAVFEYRLIVGSLECSQ